MDKRRYVVVGGLPEPSGGVTVFNGDLVELLLSRGHDVIVFDQNAGQKQSRFQKVEIRMWRGGPGLFFHVWVSISLLRLRADRVLLHTSNTSGLLGLLVPLARGMRCAAFLHNGQVETKGLSAFPRAILRRLMKRVDRTFIMSPTQKQRLIEMEYPMNRVSRIIPVLLSSGRGTKAPTPLADRPMRILACGHEQRIYNFEFAVRLAQELSNTEVHLYLYGTHIDEGYLEELRELDIAGRMHVHRDKDRTEFLEGLGNARLFIRPNHVDSFGVSVVDALQSGTPVVASDVCNRADGAIIFPAGDYDHFRSAVTWALTQDTAPATDPVILQSTRNQIIAMIEDDEANAV